MSTKKKRELRRSAPKRRRISTNPSDIAIQDKDAAEDHHHHKKRKGEELSGEKRKMRKKQK